MASIAAVVCFAIALLLELIGASSPFNFVLAGFLFMALWMLIGNWPLGGRFPRQP